MTTCLLSNQKQIEKKLAIEQLKKGKGKIPQESDKNRRERTLGGKYGNIKTERDGIIFDSKLEADRWDNLKLLESAGEIRDLNRQVPFLLIPKQVDPETGKVLERQVVYYADFQYYTKDGDLVVEDTKSPATRKRPEYVIKRKLLLERFKIRLVEIEEADAW